VQVNEMMMDLVKLKENKSSLATIDLEAVMQVLKMYLVHSSINTKVHTLIWIHHLFKQAEDEMAIHAGNLLPVLLNILNDPSDDVVLSVLTVIADIIKSTRDSQRLDKYRIFLESLLQQFGEDKNFLDSRGTLIVRQLCALLNAEYIYRTLAEILSNETENVKFVSIMVRKLNNILFTSSELFELRKTLKNIQDPSSAELFVCLYKCWCFCPISTISICLLANCFQHVARLVEIFGSLEMTIDYLEEIDKLIQLIESPIFACKK
jgi:vacuole morphology and inheritance protein 14